MRPDGPVYVAVVGPGDDATAGDIAAARRVGALIAARGWITLTGGRATGVMHAAAEGAASAGGIAVGLLPGSDRRAASAALSVALPTGLGEARNTVIVTAADAVIACGMSAGTLSEIALALKSGRPVVLLGVGESAAEFLDTIGPVQPLRARDPENAVQLITDGLMA